MQKIVVLFAAIAVFVGCAKPPMIEVDAARAGMDGARAADAEKFAPTHFAKAESLLQGMEKELSAQAQKSALFRSYIKTKDLAVATQAAATVAEVEAKKVAAASGNTFGAGGRGENPFEHLLSSSSSSGQVQQKLSCTCTCTPQI